MTHMEWHRHLSAVAEEHSAELEDRGAKYVLKLPNGASVYASKTPSHPARDRVRSDIRKALKTKPRTT